MAKDDTSKFLDTMTQLPSIRRSLSADPIATLKAVSTNIGVKPDQVDLAAVELAASLTDVEAKLIQDLRARIPEGLASGHDGAIIF